MEALVLNVVKVGTIEVLGAVKVVKLGIKGVPIVSCGAYTEDGGILVAFCE